MNAVALKSDSTARSAGVACTVETELPVAAVRAPRSAWLTTEGSPLPLGQSWVEEEQAYNFSLFSENASGVTLLLYDERDAATPCFTLDLDPLAHKLREFWFCRVPKASAPVARFYAYSIRGPAPGGPAIPSASTRTRCSSTPPPGRSTSLRGSIATRPGGPAPTPGRPRSEC
jgi:hypothetical protein